MNTLPVLSNAVVGFPKTVLTENSSEFDKYNAFLKEALERCANLRTPYDRATEVPINPQELEKFCDAAASLGLPIIYIGYVEEDEKGYYAAYPNFDMLNDIEKDR